MFFLMQDLRAINHMYQYSLTVFLALFKKALAGYKHPGTDPAARIAVLSSALTRLVCEFVPRGLFNADRLTFGMHLARHLGMQPPPLSCSFKDLLL